MVVWSSLKYAVAATCAIGLTQVEAIPAGANRGGVVSLSSGSSYLLRRGGQQNKVITVSGVQQGFGPAKGQVPLRKEIRQMMQNPTEFNLFLLALQRFYQKPQSDETSFYAIAGVHGRPFKSWNGVTNGMGDAKSGYCTHKDVLFLSWHRPYLALYEQLVWENARDIVNEFSEPKRTALRAVLSTLRIPYWDWAANSTIPLEVGGMVTIEVDTPKGRKAIPNPLYSYKFTDISEFSDLVGPLGHLNETVRYPKDINGTYVSQIEPLNQVMQNAAGAITNRVYKILTSYTDFNGVSTGAYNRWTHQTLDSLEGIHDDIHNAIGGPIGGPSGHMFDLSIAAFDPIFWLHHTNIDRLFAIWQGINPTGYNISGTSSFGTFTIATGTVENLDTPLTPFRQSSNGFYTSATAGNTNKFGYNYPETIDWDLPASASPQDHVNKVIAAVNRLYSQDTSSGTLSLAMGITIPKGISFSVGLADQALSTPPSPNSLAPFKNNVVEAGKYNEWSADIRVNQAALGGAFKIYFFLGGVSADPSQWDISKDVVGIYSVLTTKESAQNQLVRGTVPLTSALLHKIILEKIPNLRRETIIPYLAKNLKCKIAVVDSGNVVDIKNVADLVVSISSTVVALPKKESELPKWESPEVAINFIDVPKGVIPAQN
ncbi:Tyrosinase [Dactylellina cionopaga]|nr:Tyrosinase [Dactylellina cionopaga]